MADVSPQARLIEIVELLAAWGELEMRKNRMLARPRAEGEAPWAANDGSPRAKEWHSLCTESEFCTRDAEEWADELNTLLKTNCIKHGDCVEHPDTVGKACALRAWHSRVASALRKVGGALHSKFLGSEPELETQTDSQESRQRAKDE